MEFFAGANTVNGFVSLFDECFRTLRTLYILKGSSGCGKSTLMRRIAGRAQREGLEYHIIRCSGDPDSLDGVILPSLSVAVADGTSPHTLDAKYPCVRERLINLGEFWDEAKIMPHREKIMLLADKKREHYENAYNTLACYKTARDSEEAITLSAVDRKKANELALSLAERSGGEKGEIKTLLTSAFTQSGIKTLETFGNINRVYRVKGKNSHYIASRLALAASELGLGAYICPSPLDTARIESVYFEASGNLFTLLDTPPCKSYAEEINISSARFTDNTRLADSRNRQRLFAKLGDELLKEAQLELAEARKLHSELESLYIPAMDFKRLDEYTLKLSNSVFSNK